VFENRVLRRIFGPKRDEVTGEWRKLCNEELSDLNFSPSIVWMQIEKNEFGQSMWHIWGRESCSVFSWRNLRERDHLENPCLDGRIILRWILRKWDV